MKKIKILIITILFISIVSFLLFENKKKNQENQFAPQEDVIKVEAPYEPLYDPVDRQDRIKDVLSTNGGNYKKYSFIKDGDKDYIVTYFQRNKETENSPDLILRRHEQGILVFKKLSDGIFKLVWESEEEFFDPRYRLGVHDLTGDGVKEIILALNNDKGGAVVVYKYTNNNEFNLITPYVDYVWFDGKTTKSIAFGADSGDTYVSDLDNDNIPEIIFPYNVRIEKNTDEYNQVYRSYKWDGQRYFLWKEQENMFAQKNIKSILEIINE